MKIDPEVQYHYFEHLVLGMAENEACLVVQTSRKPREKVLFDCRISANSKLYWGMKV